MENVTTQKNPGPSHHRAPQNEKEATLLVHQWQMLPSVSRWALVDLCRQVNTSKAGKHLNQRQIGGCVSGEPRVSSGFTAKTTP